MEQYPLTPDEDKIEYQLADLELRMGRLEDCFRELLKDGDALMLAVEKAVITHTRQN